MTRVLRHILACLLLLGSLPALAVNYVFPGNLPAGCTRAGSSANYTCPGGGGLSYGDTVTIQSPMPATITVTGNMSTNNARINEGGSASNLNLIVQGTITAEYQALINANVTAASINGVGSEVQFGGTVSVSGSALLGYRTRVAGNFSSTSLTTGTEVQFGGNVSTTTGTMALSDTNTIAGNLSSGTGAVTLGGSTQVTGTVNCNCAVTLNSQTRITGNVTAASVNSTSQAYLMGSVTTTGAVDLAYGATLGGAITAGSTIRLRGATQAPQCLRSTSSSAIQLDWADRANGGVCCGASNACTSSCVVNNSGAAMPALCSTPSSTPPGRFNAFETGTTPATAISGVIRTKVSGSSFSLAVVAVNSTGTGVATNFTGTVRVEVLNSGNDSGAVNTTTQCRSTWAQAAGTSSTTLTFAAGDLGRKNVTLTVPDAFRNARIRITYPDTGTATVTGCSNDNFAVRPSTLNGLRVTDSTASSPTTAMLSRGDLDNMALTGGKVHKAGRPFTLSATAQNATGATTTLYDGTPTPETTSCNGRPSSPACTVNVGTVTASTTPANGVINTPSATYSESGAFYLRLVDTAFAAVDEADSSTAERYVTSAQIAVGRFVPDRFTVVADLSGGTPRLRTFGSTCSTRSFTYLGQPFGYDILPVAVVTPVNFAGGTITNYSIAAKIGTTGFDVLQAYGIMPASPGLASVPVPLFSVTGGVATLRAQAADRLTVQRPTAAPMSRFNAALSLRWEVRDTSETAGATGNEDILTTAPQDYTLGFDSGSEFRYGQLRLASAYGSELTALAVPIEAQYYNGTSFVTNDADSCTSVPTASVSLANFRGNLAACETAPTTTNVTLASGRGVLRMAAPRTDSSGVSNAGSVDGTLQLADTITAGALRCSAVGAATSAASPAALSWLQMKLPGGTAFNQNPSARFSFGQYRSPLIYQRELY